MADIDAPADVAAFLESVAALLDDEVPHDARPADQAAGAAEDRAVTRARARQARSRAAALGERVEGLWHRHEELRDATAHAAPARASATQQQATGMLMVVFGLTASQAGQLLAMLGWRQDSSPDELARRMVAACERGADPVAMLRGGGEDGRGRAPLVVRRAMAFIEQNAGRDIGIDDIGAAAGVGKRGLQHAFRRYCGVSPIRYLRQVRMANAHRDLVSADPSRGDTVAAIADAWQFTHHGRFALDYRTAYGVTPGQTLRG
ncbi:AraC-type DNA-binding protein [Pseudonocardia ammonioxydans]|uniref:AraC-type DNA-binding protein n=1 Tax=Pseudonocardia ammonioxydans TaxID=260086 RepID=A0A1I4TIV6_PSUAM|nr:helix-turn-helix transcriptional regulator [Pseudonocardia ammonioxydans]SFM76585.1 AraC-type DNA-binding protein [Pseudonocardia ammonioxydans]